MSNKNFKIKDTHEALILFSTAWENQDIELSRQAMTYICENRPLEELEANLLVSIESAMELFRSFVTTGLDCTEDGTPTRAFFLKVNRYVIDNATPEINQAIEAAFNKFYGKDLKPCGCDDNGQPCYSMADFCDAVGCTEEQALRTMEGREGNVRSDRVHRIQ